MMLLLQNLSLDDFLAWENQQVEKHEFHRGEVFAADDGRRTHGRVVLSLLRCVVEQLDGLPRQVFAQSMKVQIGADTIDYSDLFVTCDKVDLATEMIFRSPILVIEVLSPSTQA